jgi:hypothetical protein
MHLYRPRRTRTYSEPIASQASSAFVDGIHVALLAAAGAAVLAAAPVVSVLPRRDAPVSADESEAALAGLS